MSGKAADVHHKTHSDPQQQTYGKRRHPSVQQGARSGQPISRDDFLTMQREVQQVGKCIFAVTLRCRNRCPVGPMV